MKFRHFCTAAESALLLVVLGFAVLVTMEPWSAYFFSGLADHWDTKLMGQWMAWSADKILQGKILLPDFNANFFYPHSYTLAFGDTFWIPSFVYAVLYVFSDNLFLSFNGTMLFFWALSGVTMFALLRELSLSRTACYLGAFIFCLIPFRLSYYYLFTATLVFAIPLLLLLLIRWLRQPDMTRALLFCAGFWVSLTSNLYYTVILFTPLLLVFVAYVVANRDLLKQRRFYITAGVMAATIGAVSVVYLYPYIVLRTEAGYARTTWDHLRYYVEIFHYLSTKFSAFAPGFFNPPYRPVETIMFPGTVLGVLSLVYFGACIARAPGQFAAVGRVHDAFMTVKFGLWTLFWIALLLNFYVYSGPWLGALNGLFYVVSLALMLLYLASVIWPRGLSERDTLISAFAAGSVVCFFLSLGPIITMMVGPDAHVVQLSRGPMAGPLESLPMFGGVRALARFGVVVYVYLIIVSCCVMDAILRKHRAVLWGCLIIPFLLVYEGSQVQSRFRHKFVDYTNIVNSPVMAKARALPEDSVLFQLPAGGTKRIDATMVMQTIGDFHYLVNGHSGFWPAHYYDISSWVRDWRLDEVTDWLREIWPPVYLVLDRGAVKFLSTSWHRPFPQAALDRSWTLLEQDQYYALYELEPRLFTTHRIIRRVRSDVLVQNPIFSFSARGTTTEETVFRARLNDVELGDYVLAPSWQTYEIALPKDYPRNLAGDEIILELVNDGRVSNVGASQSAWQVKGLRFSPNH